MIRLATASAILLLVSQTAVADALTASELQRCNAMAATLAPKKAEIESFQTKRDELATLVEVKGETWEEAEVHRLASEGHARKADIAQRDYHASKQDLAKSEQVLQSLVRQLNQDIASYNQACATDD